MWPVAADWHVLEVLLTGMHGSAASPHALKPPSTLPAGLTVLNLLIVLVAVVRALAGLRWSAALDAVPCGFGRNRNYPGCLKPTVPIAGGPGGLCVHELPLGLLAILYAFFETPAFGGLLLERGLLGVGCSGCGRP